MKTQIIRLEPHDNVISARDRMGWGQTGRILLVWPERGRLLNQRLDLVLLQRRSKELGAQLALVTNDRDVKYHARQLAIPVFSNLRRAQSAHWRVPRRFRGKESLLPEGPETPTESAPPEPLPKSQRVPRPERPVPQSSLLVRLSAFTLGVLALLAISAVLFPAAQLRLTPATKSQDLNLTVQANPELQEINLSGVVPAQAQTVIVEGRDHLATSGVVIVPDQFASGSVTFTNLTDQPVKVPADTVVATTGEQAVRFITTRAGTIPVGSDPTLTLPVRALTPGRRANLPRGSLVAIEGLLGTQATVTNPRPTAGGTELNAPGPSNADRRTLKEQLLASLRTTALSELQASLQPGDLILPASLEIKRTLEESYEPATSQPADLLSLDLRLEFQVQVVAAQDLEALANAVLDANLPDGYAAIPHTLTIEHQGVEALSDPEAASWQMHIHRQIQARLPANAAVSLVLGQSPEQAAQRLVGSLPLKSQPGIYLNPSWWPRLPIVPFRISVSLVTAGN